MPETGAITNTLRRTSDPKLRICAPFSVLRLIYTFILGSTVIAAESPRVVVSQQYHNSWRGSVNDIPVMVLRGSATERAKAHGVLAADDIVDLIK